VTKGRGSRLQSVERAILILKAFNQEKPERGVSELSRELGLHKSTVSRLMQTLEHGGLLARSADTERYRLGVDLIGLAAQVVDYLDAREVARPHLRLLAESCRETTVLSVLDGGQVVNLEQFVPHTRRIKNIGRVGRRMDPHCTAAGKVLLAYLPPHGRDLILDFPLQRFTPYTITSSHELARELDHICEQGYAVAQEELEEGLAAIAAPLRDHRRQVVAAIAVAGPAYRIAPGMYPELAAQLVDAAARISEQLGYKPLR
jgi:DNA-binding IclR family transcriptional regulator